MNIPSHTVGKFLRSFSQAQNANRLPLPSPLAFSISSGYKLVHLEYIFAIHLANEVEAPLFHFYNAKMYILLIEMSIYNDRFIIIHFKNSFRLNLYRGSPDKLEESPPKFNRFQIENEAASSSPTFCDFRLNGNHLVLLDQNNQPPFRYSIGPTSLLTHISSI